MWLPEVNQDVTYRIRNGVVFGLPHVSRVDTSGMLTILDLADDQAPSLLDSSDAWMRALVDGRREVAERLETRPGEQRLRGNRAGHLVWSVGWGRFFPHSSFTVVMDARTGEILEQREESPPPSNLIEPAG